MEFLRICIWTAVIGFACMAAFLFFLGMAGAIAFDKPEWVDLFYFLTIMSEGVALVIAVLMVFLNS